MNRSLDRKEAYSLNVRSPWLREAVSRVLLTQILSRRGCVCGPTRRSALAEPVPSRAQSITHSRRLSTPGPTVPLRLRDFRRTSSPIHRRADVGWRRKVRAHLVYQILDAQPGDQFDRLPAVETDAIVPPPPRSRPATWTWPRASSVAGASVLVAPIRYFISMLRRAAAGSVSGVRVLTAVVMGGSRSLGRSSQAACVAGAGVLVAVVGAFLSIVRRAQAGFVAGVRVLTAVIGGSRSLARSSQTVCVAGAGVLVAAVGAFVSIVRRAQAGRSPVSVF